MATDTIDIAGLCSVLRATPAGAPVRIAVLVPGFTTTKELLESELEALASRGALALSLDPVGHGDRGSETTEELAARGFGAFRAEMWSVIGLTAVDVMRVIDWSVDQVDVEVPVVVGGISMGGDIAISVAGVHPRVRRAAAIVSTPDWTRPGMCEIGAADTLVDQGEPTTTSSWLRDQFEPLSNVGAYGDDHDILFLNGADDTHVPGEAAHRFATAVNAGRSRPVVVVEDAAGLGHLGAAFDASLRARFVDFLSIN